MAGHEISFFLWDPMGLVLAPPLGASPHSHHAREICLALDGRLDVLDGSGVRLRGVRGALIDSRVEHRVVERCRSVATLLVGPLTAPGFGLGARLGGNGMAEVAAGVVDGLTPWLEALRNEPSLDDAEQVAARIIASAAAPESSGDLDGRIAQALEMLGLSFSNRIPQSTFASALGLSTGDFCHLFREQVGVPLHGYRQWLRLRSALSRILAGQDLETAAAEAGFADTGELDRVCRSTFGVSPERLAELDSFFADQTASFPVDLRPSRAPA